MPFNKSTKCGYNFDAISTHARTHRKQRNRRCKMHKMSCPSLSVAFATFSEYRIQTKKAPFSVYKWCYQTVEIRFLIVDGIVQYCYVAAWTTMLNKQKNTDLTLDENVCELFCVWDTSNVCSKQLSKTRSIQKYFTSYHMRRLSPNKKKRD